MSELIGIREAARRLGVSDTAVHKAIKAGRVTLAAPNPTNGRPRLSWPECRDQWVANSDSSKRSHVGGTGKSPARALYERGGPAEVDLPVSSSGAGPGSAKPAARRPAAAAAAAPPPPADEPDDGVRAGGGRGGLSYAESRALREAYQARLAKLEFEERSGKLVNVEQVKVEAFKTHRRIRDALLNIPDRCAPHLATITDPMECHTYLLEEIVEALRQLSADIYRPGGGSGV